MANIDSEHHSDHYKITAAGWAYRSNDRGWIIYQQPQTGRWHVRSEAVAIVATSARPPSTETVS